MRDKCTVLPIQLTIELHWSKGIISCLYKASCHDKGNDIWQRIIWKWDCILIKLRLYTLACIYMDLRNVSCLLSTSGHHWERDGSRQNPEPLDSWISWLSSAYQNSNDRLVDNSFLPMQFSATNFYLANCFSHYFLFEPFRVSYIKLQLTFIQYGH